MNINIIVAVTRTGAIGRDGDMLYHISGDLRYFKTVTMGCPVIMGRRTFESLPHGPLPGRHNIVITRNTGLGIQGVTVAHSLDDALRAAADAAEVFIIGGGEIYRQAMPLAHSLYITEIDSDADGDTHFPAVDPSAWHEDDVTEWQSDPRTGVSYRFRRLSRRGTDVTL